MTNEFKLVKETQREALLRLEELKMIVMKTKSVQEQENIVTFDHLIKKHKLKVTLNSDTSAKEIFTDIDMFRTFEDTFMKNESFVTDLVR